MTFPRSAAAIAMLSAFLAFLPIRGEAEPVARKFIGTGWDTLRISPEEVLANAPAFADSGLPVAVENAAGWRTASRVVVAPDRTDYNEMYLMIDTREAGPDDVAWVDNVHVYKLDFKEK
jgi:hypothetical protein